MINHIDTKFNIQIKSVYCITNMTIITTIHNAVTPIPIFNNAVARSWSLCEILKYAMMPPIIPNNTGYSINNPLGFI